jgi:hypothetical protein
MFGFKPPIKPLKEFHISSLKHFCLTIKVSNGYQPFAGMARLYPFL